MRSDEMPPPRSSAPPKAPQGPADFPGEYKKPISFPAGPPKVVDFPSEYKKPFSDRLDGFAEGTLANGEKLTKVATVTTGSAVHWSATAIGYGVIIAIVFMGVVALLSFLSSPRQLQRPNTSAPPQKTITLP